MARRIIATFVLWVGVSVGSGAHAAITAFWQQVTITPEAIANDPALAGMHTWDLTVTTDGNWVSAAMRAVLPQGFTFYKHPLGGPTRPDPALFGTSPALEFTTYVSAPSDDGTNNSTLLFGGHPQGHPMSLGDPTSLTPGDFSMDWGDTFIVDPPGTYQIGRLTFPQGVLPDVFNHTPMPVLDPSHTSQLNPDSTAVIPDIPEPGPLGLLAALTLFCRARKRGKPITMAVRSRGLALAEPLESRRLLSFAASFPAGATLSERTDVNVSPWVPPNLPGNTGNEAESLVVVNPTNPRNVVAFAVDHDDAGISLADKAWYSFDGGLTFSVSPIAYPPNHIGGGDPAAAFNRAGTLYYIHLTRTQSQSYVSIAISTNGGQDWAQPIIVAEGSTVDKCWITTGPDPAHPTDLTKDIVYVFYVAGGVRCARFLNPGMAFGGDVQVNNDGIGGGNPFAHPVARSDGRVFVVWQRYVDDPDPADPDYTEIRLDYSDDGSVTWRADPDLIVGTTLVTGQSYIPAAPGRRLFATPSVAVANTGANAGRLFVSYTTSLNGLPDTDITVGYTDNLATALNAPPPAQISWAINTVHANHQEPISFMDRR